MDKISRKDAKDSGLKHYFTGVPCKYGHTSKRFTSSGNCVECLSTTHSSKRLKWARDNKEKARASNAISHQKYKDQRNAACRRRYNSDKSSYHESSKQWAKENRNRSNDFKKKWRESNLDQSRNAARNWQKKNRDKVNANAAKRRAIKLKATPPWVDYDKIQEFYTEAARLTKETGASHHVDHIIPLQHELVCGLHVHTNLQILTAFENCSKGNNFQVD